VCSERVASSLSRMVYPISHMESRILQRGTIDTASSLTRRYRTFETGVKSKSV
jgi:hypothetical protein